jgi:pimeloyl-ACP methyl ester carboxylesterase
LGVGRTSKSPVLVVVIVVFAAVAACTSTERNPSNAPSIENPSGGSSAIDWEQCPDDYFVEVASPFFDRGRVDCATIDVPAVYGGDSGLPDFRLALLRLRTTGDAAKRGTLFVNPGGPGGSGIEVMQQQLFPKAVQDSYDIVGFDPRGVLHSQPVSGEEIRCSDELDFSSYWMLEATPANQAQVDERERAEREYRSDCQRRNPAWWTLGTRNVVRDLEQMRKQVTGDADLNFLGSSYGTTIAAGYLSEFPEHVGHLVLDSPTDDSPNTDASIVTEARSINDYLLRLVDGYAETKGITRSTVVRELEQIRDWGEDDQLRGYAGLEPFPAYGSYERLSNEYMFFKGLSSLLYYDLEQAQELFNLGMDEVLQEKWNWRFEYLALALDGYDTDVLLEAYQDKDLYDPHGYTRSNLAEISQMVNGIDRDQRDTRSHAQLNSLDRKTRAAAPLLWTLGQDPSNFRYFVEQGGNRWSWVAFEDPDIPDPPKSAPPRTNPSGKPVMVIGSRHEAITPYAFAVSTADALGSALITWVGEEHAPLAGFRHECLNHLFVDYLIHDTLPEEPVTCD